MAETPRLPNLATLITPLIKRGVNAREGMRMIEASGVQVERHVLAQAWGGVIRSIGNRAAVVLAPPSRRPGPQERTVWNTNRQRGYLYQIEMQMQLGDTDQVVTRLHSVRTPTLITYGDAMDDAMGYLTDVTDEYGEVVLGGVVTGVYEMRPEAKYYGPIGKAAIEQFGAGVTVTEVPLFGGGVAVRGAGGRFVGGINTE